MKLLKPNAQRGKIARLLFIILLIAEAGSLFAEFIQYNMLNQIDNGQEVLFDEAERMDIIYRLANLFCFLIIIASFIALIFWFRRAYYNLHIMTKNLKHGEGWAAGG